MIPVCNVDYNYKIVNDSAIINVKLENGISTTIEYSMIDELFISNIPIRFEKKLIKNIKTAKYGSNEENSMIEFVNCIFFCPIDFSYKKFQGKISFISCIFLNDVDIYGDYDSLNIEMSNFLDCSLNLQGSYFKNFVMNLNSFIDCNIIFDEAYFDCFDFDFTNSKLKNTNCSFSQTTFSNICNIINLHGNECDEKSKLRFSMIDFKVPEVRLNLSVFNILDFFDCTFECNRFSFDCQCKTLLLQECRNFRILSLQNIMQLENLNILNFINTGKLIINNDSSIYIRAIKTSNSIVRDRKGIINAPSLDEIRLELFTLLTYTDISQSDFISKVKNEIKQVEMHLRIKNSTQEPMKIFLSYSWKDERLANSIENMFKKKNIKTIRDKKDLKYKGNIKQFMSQIRYTDFSLLIISDDYLKSLNCMYEVSEFIKDDDYSKRILPIIKDNANIFNTFERSKYTLYWQDEYDRLKKEYDKTEELNRGDIIKGLIKIERVQRDLSDFLEFLSSVNIIKCGETLKKIDFEKITTLVFEEI